jgi:hypothetical protein
VSNDYVWDAYYAPHLAGRSAPSDRQQLATRVLSRVLIELAMNRYEWRNLPDEVSGRWLELNVVTRGLAVFFHDDEITNKYVALSGSGYGTLDLQGNYTQYQVWGNGAAFFNQQMPAKDVVPIWGNLLRTNDLDIIDLYAPRLAQFDTSIEINALNARRTKIIPVSENRKLTFDNINRQIVAGNPVVKVTDTVASLLGDWTALDLGIDPDMIVNLDIARDRQWAKVCNLLGINTANQDKKERLVAAEVSGNNDEIENIRWTGLQARQLAAEQMNDRFGLDVEVGYHTQLVQDEQAQEALDAQQDVVKDTAAMGAGSKAGAIPSAGGND